MNTIRRGLKRKDREEEGEYQAGLNQFQVDYVEIDNRYVQHKEQGC